MGSRHDLWGSRDGINLGCLASGIGGVLASGVSRFGIRLFSISPKTRSLVLYAISSYSSAHNLYTHVSNKEQQYFIPLAHSRILSMELSASF